MNKIIKRLKKILFRLKDTENHLKFRSTLSAELIKPNGEVKKLDIISKKCITNAAVNYLVDSFQDSTTYPMDDFVYHDSGTGTTAEATSDTALVTPCGEARDEGTKEEGDSSNIFKSIATHTYSGTFAITEHGLFSYPSDGTLWDRSVFDAINVESNYRIRWTYLLTIDAGG